jgi:long-chain acyl-CoA synthetase
MMAAHWLHRHALAVPDAPAIYLGTSLVATHGQWARRAGALARQFQGAGLQPGDRVALFMRNHVRYLDVMLGAWWAGLAVVPINAKLHPHEAQWIIDDAQARWAFVSGEVMGSGDEASGPSCFSGVERQVDVDSLEDEAWWATLEQDAAGITGGLAALPQPLDRAPDDLAWLFYTSGTTGRPKGVMITHRNLQTMAMGYFVDVDPVSRQDRIVYAAPMSHGNGLYALPHLMAGAVHVVPASGGFDADELFDLGFTLGPLSLFAAPTIVNRIVACAQARGLAPQDCARAFKTIVYGGAPMYAADIERALKVMGPRFVQIYGQGETPMTGTVLARHHLADVTHPRHRERLASIGVAQTPVQVRIAGHDGEELPPGETGEVLVRGDSVMAGYWCNPEATAATIRDGWLWTGDMGSQDEDGFITLKDRSKDLIISGGSNIYPREVEEVLLQHAGVAEVAVVGEPHPEWGEAVVAFVVAQDSHSPHAAQLDAWCLARIARFKRPKRYVFVEGLPKNAYGKVLKRELRDLAQGRNSPQQPPANRQEHEVPSPPGIPAAPR